MKHTYIISALLTLAIYLSACEDKKMKQDAAEVTQHAKDSGEQSISATEEQIIYWVTEIDEEAEKSVDIAYSLQLSNEREEVQAYIYHVNGIPTRIEEKYSDYIHKTYGTRYYYLQNDELILSKEIKDEVLSDSTYQMRETVTFYSDSKPTKSTTRTAAYEEELLLMSFTEIPLQPHPFNEVIEIINNTGDYRLSFSDIIETEHSTFIIFATKSAKKYTTALMVEYRDDFANQLLSNKKKYKGKLVEVDFELVTDNGMTFQAYRGGKFID